MLQRLVKDESGVALGLAIIVVVLVGVMGAGLLVFVRSDLSAVVQTNQGQRAFDIADAGVQDAKRQLFAVDATRQHYDLDHTNDCTAGQRLYPEDWSPATTVYANQNCTGGTTTRTAPGVSKDFAGGRFTVTIQCYRQEPVADCAGVTENAPEAVPASTRNFFKITSTGEYGGARRKVEAIYFASRSQDVPTAYFANNGNINLSVSGISGVSFFAGNGNIIISDQRKASLNRTSPALFGDWMLDPYNTQRRASATGAPSTGVGLGANGWICPTSTCNSSANSSADGIHDYDRSTGTKGSRKAFFRKASPTDTQTASQITFPFDPNKNLPVDLLREEARRQGNYYTRTQLNGNIDTANWPANSTDRTVFFVDANGQDVTYRVTLTPQPRGVLVVNNGNLTTSSSSSGLNGFGIITGNGSQTGNYTSSGSATISGFVYSSGSQTLSGSLNPSPNASFTNVPGFYGVSLWSWRELYA